MKIYRSFVVSLLLILTGCGQVNDPTPMTPQDASPTPEDSSQNADEVVELTPLPTLTSDSSTEGEAIPNPSDPTLARLIEMAKEDLAQRLSVTATSINLMEIEEVEWSDSSLGCPQPGMEYLQVITPGYRILLESNGSQHEYHSNRDAHLVYCAGSIQLDPPPKP